MVCRCGCLKELEEIGKSHGKFVQLLKLKISNILEIKFK